jgi:hypothetical protein
LLLIGAAATLLAGCGAPTSVTTVSSTTVSSVPSTVTTTEVTVSVQLYPIIENNKHGYIDRSGKVVIEPRYDEAMPFSEGLARVGIGDTDTMKWGYIDATGTMVIAPQFYAAWDFSEGVALVSDRTSYWFIDKTGATVLKPQCTFANSFSDGLALITVDGLGAKPYAYIDHTGAVVIPPRFWQVSNFSEGLAAVAESAGEGVAPRYGYMDTSGNYAIQPQFWSAAAFSDGLALVATGPGANSGRAYIDHTGTAVVHLPAITEEPHGAGDPTFSEGLAAFYDQAKHLWGYIDKTGAVAIPARFTVATRFSEGLAAAAQNNAPNGGPVYGYIDTSGTFVIPAQYASAGRFSGGLASVVVRDASGTAQRSYIDQTGKVVWTHAGP